MPSKTALRNSLQHVDDFYANYITRDGPNMLANWTIFMHYIKRNESNMLANLTILTIFTQIPL